MIFTTIIILIILGIAAYYFWVQRPLKQLEAKSTFKPYKEDELRIENAGPGAVIHLTGIGKDMDEFDLKVISKHTYRQLESTWYELECDKGEKKIWIDMEEDDELDLAVGLRKLKLRDVNITKEDLIRFDDDEDGSFEFEGDKYWLEDSDAAVFYRHSNDKEAEKLYYWDFETEDEKKYISIEKWSDGSYDVTYSEPMRSSQVTVYTLK